MPVSALGREWHLKIQRGDNGEYPLPPESDGARVCQDPLAGGSWRRPLCQPRDAAAGGSLRQRLQAGLLGFGRSRLCDSHTPSSRAAARLCVRLRSFPRPETWSRPVPVRPGRTRCGRRLSAHGGYRGHGAGSHPLLPGLAAHPGPAAAAGAEPLRGGGVGAAGLGGHPRHEGGSGAAWARTVAAAGRRRARRASPPHLCGPRQVRGAPAIALVGCLSLAVELQAAVLPVPAPQQ